MKAVLVKRVPMSQTTQIVICHFPLVQLGDSFETEFLTPSEKLIIIIFVNIFSVSKYLHSY